MHIQSNSICITVKVYSNNSLGFNHTSKTTNRFSSLNRLPLTVHLCPVHNLLIKFWAKKPRVGVFLHEAVDLGLDLIETGWCWFQKFQSGLFPGPEVYVNLKKGKETQRLYSFIHNKYYPTKEISFRRTISVPPAPPLGGCWTPIHVHLS